MDKGNKKHTKSDDIKSSEIVLKLSTEINFDPRGGSQKVWFLT